MGRYIALGTWLLAFSLLVAAVDVVREPVARRQVSPTARIRYYLQKTADDPEHYPGYALLGAAFLDKARESHDPSDLQKARMALDRSLRIQSNLDALKTWAALCNFAHRFEEAVLWGRRSLEAMPEDTQIVAMLVESHLALGQIDEAEKLVSWAPGGPEDFYMAAALGQWRMARGEYEAAAEAYLKAAEFPGAAKFQDLVVWAQVSAAGALIDSGQFSTARPLLEAAARLDSRDSFLRIHQAELLEGEGAPQRALAILQATLEERADPTIHARAFHLARQLGQNADAERHFAAAEREFQKVIDAGEVFTLEAMARLYFEAGKNLAEALALAERNIEYKRDAPARELVESIRQKLRSTR